MLLQSCGDPFAAILQSTYPNLLKNMDDPSFFHDMATLAPKNAIVDAVIDYMLDLRPDEKKNIEVVILRIMPSQASTYQMMCTPMNF